MANDPYSSFSSPLASAAGAAGPAAAAGADPYSGFSSPAQNQTRPAADILSLTATPEPSLVQRIGGELRNALSPVLGESDQQKQQRMANIEQLRSISPSLADYAQQNGQDTGGVAGHIADTAMRTTLATAGQALGALGGPFDEVTIPLGGFFGAASADYLVQKRRIAAGEQDSIHPGEIVGSGISGIFPGGSLAKSGTGAVISQAVKQGVGGLASDVAQTGIDQHKLPGMKDAAWATILPSLIGALAERTSQANPEIAAARSTATAAQATKQGIKDAFQAEGGVVNPADANPTALNKAVISFAGGPSVNQAATHINGEVADHIARTVLDPANPDGVELSQQVAQAVRKRSYDVGYTPVASSGVVPVDTQYVNDLRNIYNAQQGAARSFPLAVNNDVEDLIKSLSVPKFDAGDALKMTQILRNQASDSFAQGNSQLGGAQRQASRAIEDQIERHLSAQAAGTVSTVPNGGILPPTAGNPASQQQAADMLANFRDARTLMAQSHDIEDAVREGTNSINPRVLASNFNANPQKLSGGVKTIGAFANAFPKVSAEASRTSVPGATATGRLIPAMAGALAGTGLAASGHGEASALATAAGLLVPTARNLVRSMVLSGPYQRIMTKIPVSVESKPDLSALIIRQGGQAAADQSRNPQAVPDDGQPAQSSP